MTEEFMLDTNMFDEVVDGNIDLSLLRNYDATFYVTPVQREELSNADGSRGQKLLNTFQSVADKEEDSIFAFDTKGAGWGDGAWATEEQRKAYDKIREEHAPDESEDVNIAAVAVSEGIIVVTADRRLRNALERTYPNLYISKEDFVSKIN
jgi:predicted nucleic acid-binding protein